MRFPFVRNGRLCAVYPALLFSSLLLCAPLVYLSMVAQTSTKYIENTKLDYMNSFATTVKCKGFESKVMEEYFNVRFNEEIQNMLHEGNETEYVRQIKMAQSTLKQAELASKVRKIEEDFATKLSSIEKEYSQLKLQLQQQQQRTLDKTKDTNLFPADRVGNYIVDMARVPRDSFKSSFSSAVGVEFLDSYYGATDLLLIYGSYEAIPNNFSSYQSNMIPLIDDASLATENCDELRVIFTSQGKNMRQCFALIPNTESFHIHSLARPSMFGGPGRSNLIVNRTKPMQSVSRYHRLQIPSDPLLPPPRFEQETKLFFDYLRSYLDSIDVVLQEVRDVVSKIAINNQVVVMMCNYGQSVLLINFICTATARNLNLSNVIVFTTDQEAADLVTSFGLTAYYDQGRFGEHPKEAAAQFGDVTFRAMAMSKIRVAQIVSVLGYDFLFQDVDVVWFKSPLEFFQTHADESTFDMYFQKDGLISKYNIPYGVNTGLYYVRNNDRTQYFFTSLLLNGDTIFRSHNDQEDIGVRLADQSSTYGLKVKVIPRTEVVTPGGYQFHDVSPFGKNYMRMILNGTSEPVAFHMSWTEGKAHKIQFFQQMGQWYVNDVCVDKTHDELVAGSLQNKTALLLHCCSAEPIVRCHYRDKPSVIPCHDHPPIDKDAPSWW